MGPQRAAEDEVRSSQRSGDARQMPAAQGTTWLGPPTHVGVDDEESDFASTSGSVAHFRAAPHGDSEHPASASASASASVKR